MVPTPVMTPSGEVVPLGELVDVQRTTGPGQIRRVNGRRTISLAVSPPENVSLETAVNRIRDEVEPALDWLDRSLAERETDLVDLAVDPRLDPLRGSPRFGHLLDALDLPAAEPATSN